MVIPFETFVGPELLGGNADSFGIAIEALEVQGSTVELPAPGVTVIVGGNNAGKSTLLRQSFAHFIGQPGQGQNDPSVVTDIRLRKRGSAADLVGWIYRSRPIANAGSPVILGPGFQLQPNLATGIWTTADYDHRLSTLGQVFGLFVDAQQRLQSIGDQPRRPDFTEPATTTLQRLEDSPDLMSRVSAISEAAFGDPLLLDALSSNLLLRVGDPGVEVPLVNAITEEYKAALAACRRLDAQGDGMKSLIGVLLPIIASTYPIVFIDEPEAFLHPPQARILGKAIGDLAMERGTQVILATHDRNILTGLLDSETADISVVRLTRHGDVAQAKVLPAERLREVWGDPVLRYSNVLDGLFHRMVVLAENDRDCRFYAAALEAANRVNPTLIAPHDVLFIPTAGKQNMRAFAEVLRACGVPVVATPDLDMLNDEANVRKLVEAIGGSWSAFANDWRVATNEFRQPRITRKNRTVRGAIDAILDADPDGDFDGEVAGQVTRELSLESPWSRLKTFGLQAFRQSPQRAVKLLADLDAAGVVLVKVGELEGFGSGLEVAKGPRFVPAAIAAGVHDDLAARDHVRRLVSAGLVQEAALGDGVR